MHLAIFEYLPSFYRVMHSFLVLVHISIADLSLQFFALHLYKGAATSEIANSIFGVRRHETNEIVAEIRSLGET